MGYTCFEVTESDRVAHLQLSRPDKLNTMIPEFWAELPQIVNDISDQGRVRAIVVSSTGKHFCAGMDLSVFTNSDGLGAGENELGRTRANLRLNVLHLQDALTALEKARMPVLVAIQGGCVGGAVDMVTAADCRYMTEDAWFSIEEINIGMTADVGTLQRLPKLIPEGIVREYAFTGRRMSAEVALRVGLVNEVYSDQAAMVDSVLETAALIAAKSPLAVHGVKHMVNYSRDHSTADALDYMATWQSGMFQSPDMVEAMTAKLEQRDANFDDLLEVRRGL